MVAMAAGVEGRRTICIFGAASLFQHERDYPAGGAFAGRMVMDGLEDPAFDGPSGNLALRWDNYGEIPAVVVRMRVR